VVDPMLPRKASKLQTIGALKSVGWTGSQARHFACGELSMDQRP
jgi:hypothetical protein